LQAPLDFGVRILAPRPLWASAETGGPAVKFGARSRPTRRGLSISLISRAFFEADRPDRDDAPIAGRVELAAQIADLHVEDEIARL
jgi:hypothetical protein